MNIGIYIYDHAEVLDFSGPFEVFTTASRICSDVDPFQVYLISEHGGVVKARAGYRVVSDCSIVAHPALDVLIVVGGYHLNELQNHAVLDWIAKTGTQASVVASVCTGAFLLARAGILTDEKVTTHWEDIAELRDMFPALEVVSGVRWVDEGRVLTSAGISAGIDMSLHLVARLHSTELAERTARQMEFDRSVPDRSTS